MRYRLRTLLIVLALGPPLAGWLVNVHSQVQERRPYFSRFSDHASPLRMAFVGHPQIKRSKISWIRQWMGDHAVPTLLYQPSADPSGKQLREVQLLFPESTIWVWPHDASPLPPGVTRLPPDAWIII